MTSCVKHKTPPNLLEPDTSLYVVLRAAELLLSWGGSEPGCADRSCICSEQRNEKYVYITMFIYLISPSPLSSDVPIPPSRPALKPFILIGGFPKQVENQPQ